MTEHWNHSEPLDPDENFGFIYQITNLQTGKSYIGKKQYWFKRKIQKAGYKRKQTVVFESDWRTYTGSCKPLNKDIKSLGLENFECTILFQCRTLGHLTYSEANLQHKMDVLTAKLPNGEPAYYNGAILGIKFIPSGDTGTILELERKIKEANYLGRNFVSEATRQKMSETKRANSKVYKFKHPKHGERECSILDLCDEFHELDARRLEEVTSQRPVSAGNGYMRVRKSHKQWKVIG